ncbi:MAG: dialkylresorcinol condensing enzyme DarA [Bacteroidota bacterium]|jgi:hypothetical protein|nr:dialkylresorcinol condensing enzyme DarA [Bacteroidota bacterium]
MKKVLVIYYSQTGQAKSAMDSVLKPFEENKNYQLDYLLVKPKKSFPYPWSYTQFFDVFPETVQGIACELEPISINPTNNYDLIVIAYQPWFLSICVPINSFLQTPEANLLMKDKPVVTIINCRNMWLGAQEKMKKRLLNLDAKLVGNITFVDRSANLVSLITVLAFVLKGTKEKFMGIFPKYGVTEKDLAHAPVFGKIIMDNLENGQLQNIQPQLNQQGALDIRGNLLLMEGRGRALFPLYANYISKKGTQGSEQRKTRVRIFGIVLPTAILILSPVITILSRLAPLLAKKKFSKEIAYYSQNSLRE